MKSSTILLTPRAACSIQGASDAGVETGSRQRKTGWHKFTFDPLSCLLGEAVPLKRFLPERVICFLAVENGIQASLISWPPWVRLLPLPPIDHGPQLPPAGNNPAPDRRITKRAIQHAGDGITKTYPVSDSSLSDGPDRGSNGFHERLQTSRAPRHVRVRHSRNTHEDAPQGRLATAEGIFLRDLNGKVPQRVVAKLHPPSPCSQTSNDESEAPLKTGSFRFLRQPGTAFTQSSKQNKAKAESALALSSQPRSASLLSRIKLTLEARISVRSKGVSENGVATFWL